ncbi:hypothetical protein CL621_03635 [archaeon]|nr:hypothetical protein [archaeon]|tara:strand:+ start:3911 stop:4423 length:513 start_codon:yes stop_codon:yes gene_type:complete
MEFKISDEFLQNYVIQAKNIFQKFIDKRNHGHEISNSTISEAIENYFKSFNMHILIGSTKYNSCYSFALDHLGIDFPLGTYNRNEAFSEFVDSSDLFSEIENERNISSDQMIVYYFSKSNYLHAGIVEESSDKGLMAVSQWGSDNILIHPFERVNKNYGDKYKIFKVNPK